MEGVRRGDSSAGDSSGWKYPTGKSAFWCGREGKKMQSNGVIIVGASFWAQLSWGDARWRAPVPRTSAEVLWVVDPSFPKDFRETDYLNSLPHEVPARGKPLISRHTHPKRTSQSLGSVTALCCRPGRAHPLEGLQNLQCWLPLTL